MRLVFGVFLAVIILCSGCFNLSQPLSSFSDSKNIAVNQDRGANVSFNFVLPPNISSALKPATTSSSPRAEISLALLNYGNLTTPFTIIRKISDISTSGEAGFVFENVPLGTAIATFKLVGATKDGFAEFSGCADLVPGSNTIDLNASGTKMIEEVSAQAIGLLAVDSVVASKMPANMAGKMKAIILSSNQTIASDAYQVSASLKTQIQQTKIVKAVGGDVHGVALRSDGTLFSWGQNLSGQLGIYGLSEQQRPVPLKSLYDCTDISAGTDYCLAVNSSGKVYGWGNNENGRVSGSAESMFVFPTEISGLSNIATISAGYTHNLAIDSSGQVWAWGKNDKGQLGRATQTEKETPGMISGMNSVKAVCVGEGFSLAVKTDGTVWGWGDNNYFQLGTSTGLIYSTPVKIEGLANVREVVCGSGHSIALLGDGSLYSWGQNAFGQTGLGLGDPFVVVPQKISQLSDISKVSAGQFHCLAVKTDGTVYSWGRNNSLQLGVASIEQLTIPQQIAGVVSVVDAYSGAEFSFLKFQDSTFKSFGNNDGYQLGVGVNGDLSTPREMTFTW